MAAPATPKWQLRGQALVSCNCDWGCPCQFNALPTHGNCEAFGAWRIRHGRYGDVKLDDLCFANIYWWPGPVHEGNGIRCLIVEPEATPEQRKILEEFNDGKLGGTYFEIFAAACPNVREVIVGPIAFQADSQERTGHVGVPGLGEIQAEPIKNVVTGKPHRIRIDLPNGFEYKIAEVGNATTLRVTSEGKLNFEHHNCFASFYEFNWSN